VRLLDAAVGTYRPQYRPLPAICYLDTNPLPTRYTLFITLLMGDLDVQKQQNLQEHHSNSSDLKRFQALRYLRSCGERRGRFYFYYKNGADTGGIANLYKTNPDPGIGPKSSPQ
jgi:hypothetical protein